MHNRKSFAPSLSALESRDLKTATLSGGVLAITPAAGAMDVAYVSQSGGVVTVQEFDSTGSVKDNFDASAVRSITFDGKGTMFNEFFNATDFDSVSQASGTFNYFANVGAGHADVTCGGAGTFNVDYGRPGDGYHSNGGTDYVWA